MERIRSIKKVAFYVATLVMMFGVEARAEKTGSMSEGSTNRQVYTTQDAPRPYTKEQIRAGYTVGTNYTFMNMGMPAPGDTSYYTMEIVAVSDTAVTIKTQTLDAAKNPLREPSTRATPWSRLIANLHLPHRDSTVVTNEVIETPAGRFECLVYAYYAKTGVLKFSYAISRPGQPIKHEHVVDGEVRERILVAYSR